MELFEEVCEALRGLVPLELGTFRHKTHRYGTKIWFGPEAPPKEHYEAQVVGVRDVPEAEVLAIEVGFHSEYPKPADNDEVLAALLAAEGEWRPELGDEAVARRVPRPRRQLAPHLRDLARPRPRRPRARHRAGDEVARLHRSPGADSRRSMTGPVSTEA